MERTIKTDTAKTLFDKQAVNILDVRRKTDYDDDTMKVTGATWCDPEMVAAWSKTLKKDQPVVIYCARGGSVSNAVVDKLRGQGIDAALIEGGIEAWKTAGGETTTK